jgi:tetratricopeptide (TPR) repeat protein
MSALIGSRVYHPGRKKGFAFLQHPPAEGRDRLSLKKGGEFSFSNERCDLVSKSLGYNDEKCITIEIQGYTMVKLFFCVPIFTFIFTNHVYCQDNKELAAFYRLMDSAKYCERIRNYDQAIVFYEQSLTYDQFDISKTAYGAMSGIYFKQQKIEQSADYLGKFILTCGPVEHDWFAYNYKGKVQINLDSLNSKFSLNFSVYRQIIKLLDDDQCVRRIIKIQDLDQNTCKTILEKSDSLNYIALKSAIISIGHIPSFSETGIRLQGLFTMVLMNHHFHRDTAFWAPLYRKAINEGKISNRSYAFLIDDHLIRDLRQTKQLYCEYPNFANRTQYGEPLFPDKLDDIRASVYLPPLYFAAQIDSLTLPNSYHNLK